MAEVSGFNTEQNYEFFLGRGRPPKVSKKVLQQGIKKKMKI